MTLEQMKKSLKAKFDIETKVENGMLTVLNNPTIEGNQVFWYDAPRFDIMEQVWTMGVLNMVFNFLNHHDFFAEPENGEKWAIIEL